MLFFTPEFERKTQPLHGEYFVLGTYCMYVTLCPARVPYSNSQLCVSWRFSAVSSFLFCVSAGRVVVHLCFVVHQVGNQNLAVRYGQDSLTLGEFTYAVCSKNMKTTLRFVKT